MKRFAGLLAALAQITPAFTQENNNSACPAGNIDPKDLAINATGKTSFTWGRDIPGNWYMSSIVSYSNESDSGTDRNSYLSIPDDTTGNVSVCIYKFEPFNGTASGTGANGCEGAISSTCLEFIRETILKHSNTPGKCAAYGPLANSKDKRMEECGKYVTSGGSYNVEPFQASSKNCTFSDVPGVSIPDGYHTRDESYGLEKVAKDPENPKDELYDLSVRQISLFAISASKVDNGVTTDTRIVCVTPDDIKEGSRVPDEESSDESVGSWQGPSISVILLAGIFSVLLVL